MTLLHERSDFPVLINATANATNIPEAFIVKDYWVTEILRALQSSELNGHFLFKGGTSLSKAFGIINRFSEDIDLLFTDEEAGKKLRRKQMKLAETLALRIPNLQIDAANPDHFSSDNHRTSCFRYPAASTSGVLPFIIMEMGFRGGKEPSVFKKIESILAGFIQKHDQQLVLVIANLSPFNISVQIPLEH